MELQQQVASGAVNLLQVVCPCEVAGLQGGHGSSPCLGEFGAVSLLVGECSGQARSENEMGCSQPSVKAAHFSG